MSGLTLAVDFGTSNTAAAMVVDGKVRRIAIEDGGDTLPTAVFFPQDEGRMLIGSAASAALIDGEEGRYMRALKSVLGTPLFHEPRLIGKKRRTLADIVTAFLVALKSRAEAETGATFTRVLSGRPVHFHSNDPDRDAQAEADLKDCYHAAGFTNVRFMFEPEAAAVAGHKMSGTDTLGLIVDIGGGTSDFTIYRSDGTSADILGSHGIRLGGVDFDHAVSMAHVMPLLGHGGQVRRVFGAGLLPVPNAIFSDLATWSHIPFLYTRDTERLVEDLLRHAVEPDKIGRLDAVIREQLGHELAFAVERGKIAANSGTRGAEIDMGFVEPTLAAPITTGTLNASLATFRDKLREAMYQTMVAAQVTPDRIGSVVLVGGSSLMAMVEEEARATCPMARIDRSDAFTAVLDGLALSI